MGKRRRRTAVLCAIVVLGAGGAAGCGGSEGDGDGKQGGDDVARASSALKTLKGYNTVHIDGSYPLMGRVQLRIDHEGNCVGTTEYSDQGKAEVVQLGSERVWYRYDDTRLTSWRRLAEQISPDAVALHDKAAKKARGKYIETAASDLKNDPLLELCDLDKAFADLPDSVDEVKALNPVTQDGKRVVELVEQPEGDGIAVYVPEKGEPLPHGVKFEIDDEPVRVTVSDPDKPVRATPPPAAETVRSAEVTGLFPEIPESTQGR
ncbi:hypothetical protein ACFUN8_13805 [Streptomyces sp. NPDC057307]|uniref:hypothetical protein n=1 Tax=Streptomyces sp. NPDC057307 TaxID=3346096 RepID=UPI003634EC61